MSRGERNRVVTTSSGGVGIGLARFVLLACVAFGVTHALGSESAKAVRTSEVAVADGVGQDVTKTADSSSPSNPKGVSSDYIIGPSDVLAISVWKDTELTRKVLVRPDGKISLPLIGELQVSGLTTISLQRLLTQKLKDYISNPQVTVIVEDAKSRTYSVLGKVAKPGSFELAKPTTVLQAIGIAGGLLEFAKQSKIYIIRPVGEGSTETLRFNYKRVIKGDDPEQNVELKNGDTVVVP